MVWTAALAANLRLALLLRAVAGDDLAYLGIDSVAVVE
jgi:hypothetical protein